MSLIVIGAWAEKSENEPIIGMTCTPGKISFKLYATEGPVEQTVKTTGTAISGSATSNSIAVYGDALLIKKFEVSSNQILKTLDFSKCTALTELSCSSSPNITEITLPASAENQLTKVNCR